MKASFYRVFSILILGLMFVMTSSLYAEKLRIALVVKSLGNGFFEAARDGAQDAAKELGLENISGAPMTLADLYNLQSKQSGHNHLTHHRPCPVVLGRKP